MRVEIQEFGESQLAERFGIRRYPAVFVDEVLIAKPKDFGFFGETGSQGAGRYTPWLNAESKARFRRDLTVYIERALRGELRQSQIELTADDVLTQLPDFEVLTLDGDTLREEYLRGRVTLVEFWATWCPPCLKSLSWLSGFAERHPDLRILSIAVESRPQDVRRLAEEREFPFPVAQATQELAEAFGDVIAVPTLFVFDREGRTARVVFGDPPGLRAKLEEHIERLLVD